MVKSMPAIRAAAAAAVAAAAVIGTGAAPAAGAAAGVGRVEFTFTADAFGSYAAAGAAGLGAGSGRSAWVIMGCTSRAQRHADSTNGDTIPQATTTTGPVANSVSSAHAAATGTWSDAATSEVQAVSALGGLVKAASVAARAAASITPGKGRVSGGVTFAGLTVDGKAQSDHPAPNTRLSLPGVGTVTLNARTASAAGGRALVKVEAIVIVLAPGNPLGIPAGASIVIGHALASVHGPVSGLLAGRSFGTSLTGPVANSGPSFPAYVSCTGTGGRTITNQGAGTSAGPLSAGAITDTASGTDTAAELSAGTSSSIAGASVAGVLSASAVTVSASAGKAGPAGRVTVTGLTVLGVPVPLPAEVPPNTSVPLPGGTLILNRQVTGAHGILVEGVYLSLPSVGTVIIGAASAYT